MFLTCHVPSSLSVIVGAPFACWEAATLVVLDLLVPVPWPITDWDVQDLGSVISLG